MIYINENKAIDFTAQKTISLYLSFFFQPQDPPIITPLHYHIYDKAQESNIEKFGNGLKYVSGVEGGREGEGGVRKKV